MGGQARTPQLEFVLDMHSLYHPDCAAQEDFKLERFGLAPFYPLLPQEPEQPTAKAQVKAKRT